MNTMDKKLDGASFREGVRLWFTHPTAARTLAASAL